MAAEEIRQTLEALQAGKITVDQAIVDLGKEPYSDLGYAKVDHHRAIRQGAAEVIYGATKTFEQIKGISESMLEHGQKCILITRVSPEKAQALEACFASVGFVYYEIPQLALVGTLPKPSGNGTIVVASAGTSDLYVSEEAALTAEALGNKVLRLYDVGVSGIHRLLAHTEELMNAQVIITVAGMEGALASVIGGMVSCPVIAVPTSVGYGASFGGLAALLSMLNSCASGVSVVNIDNGFGAGFQAHLINHLKPAASAPAHTEGN
jgi:hypothetical protein